MADPFPWLTWDQDFTFPDPGSANDEGLVVTGGNLSPGLLLSAYRQGLFPWFSRRGEPYWYSPDPRFVLFPDELHVGATLAKVLKRGDYTVTFDTCFADVMRACAASPRPGQSGTWITGDFLIGYGELHQAGFAHSVEVWAEGPEGRTLAGGLYGLNLGRVFFGESMFSRAPNASKVGFVTLLNFLREACHLALVDCQQPSAYLASFGARSVDRSDYLQRLKPLLVPPSARGPWRQQ